MAVYISPIASITPQICSEQATRQSTTTTISERPKMRTPERSLSPPTGAPSAEGAARPKRRRGQQPGAKGPRRQLRADLPEQIINHTLEPEQLVCPCCGKVRPELSL